MNTKFNIFFQKFAVFALVVNCFLASSGAFAQPLKKDVGVVSYADIVEPLIPAVVNIHTVKYSKKRVLRDSQLPELIPFDEFSSFFKKFNLPFAFDLYSTPRALSLGSGFLIDAEGLIVTNYHVIAGSDEINVKLYDNTEFPAKVIGKDPQTDLALIKINSPKKLPFVSFGNSSEVRVGDVVIAIGNSLGFGGTVTTGVISSKGRDLGSGIDELVDDFIQTDAAINTGNSGGPLFNMQGEVIGINTSIPAVGGGINVGIGFSIPSNRAQNIVHHLKTNGKVSRGRLDIAIQENTKDLSEALNFHKDYGVLVVDVTEGGAGHKAGLQRGDLIYEFNDKKVLNLRKLQLYVAEAQINDEVLLKVMRNGKDLTLKAIITESLNSKNKGDLSVHDQNSAKSLNNRNFLEKSGILFSNLNDDLRTKFHIEEDTQGIIVIDVIADDLDTKLRVGDVIVTINQEPVKNVGEFDFIFKELKSENKKNTILLVKRRDFSMFMTLAIK